MTSDLMDAIGRDTLEDFTDRETLDARVVDGTRIHGYDVDDDLSDHYGFADTVFLTITGELPSETEARAFSALMVLTAPTTIAHAPANAARAARSTRVGVERVASTGATVLGEQVRWELDEHEEFLSWLGRDTPEGQCPANVFSADRAQSDRVKSRLGIYVRAALEQPLTRMAALIAGFFALGLNREQIATAFMLARLPAIIAEGAAAKPGDLRGYPTRVPRFEFQEN